MPVEPLLTPKAREGVVFRQLDEEWVIYDPANDRLHVLNPTAALVWTHSTGELPLAEIARVIVETFEGGVDVKTAESDVTKAVERFREAGLLE